jgi:MFS transporter, MCT family, aspergillic acid transporter
LVRLQRHSNFRGGTNHSATGLLTSFGKFQSYYQAQLLSSTNPSTIAWIGSTQFFTLFISGLLLGPLFDKFGARRLMIPGTFVYVVALMLTSISTKFWHLLLAQGFLLGFGCALQ